MRNLRKSLAVALCAGLAITALSACGKPASAPAAAPAATTAAPAAPAANSGPAAANDKKVTLTCAIVQNEDSYFDRVMEYYDKQIQEKSGGSLALDIQAGGALGGETDYVEGMQAGTIDMTLVSISPITPTAHSCGVFEIPFLFRDFEHANKVWNSEIGQAMRDELDSVGIKALGIADFGYRQTTNNVRPINSPDDVKGLKLRVMQSEIQIRAWEALGATPVTMAVTEVFTALQTGTVEGQENPINAIRSNGFYEVQKYMSFTNHMYAPILLCVSKTAWDGLTENQQKVLMDCVPDWAEKSVGILEQVNGEDLKIIQDAGVQINEVSEENLQKFRDKVRPLHEELDKEYNGAVVKILDM